MQSELTEAFLHRNKKVAALNPASKNRHILPVLAATLFMHGYTGWN